MNHDALRTAIFKWILLVCAALMTLRLYFVQQMIAAMFIFSIFFLCMAAVALMLVVLDYAGQIVLARAEATIRALGRPARLDRDSVNSSADARILTPIHESRPATGR
jgi:hypothetical protein